MLVETGVSFLPGLDVPDVLAELAAMGARLQAALGVLANLVDVVAEDLRKVGEGRVLP